LYSAFFAKRLKCAQTWITQFYMQITPCLPLLPSHRTSPSFGWYSFYRPTEGRRLRDSSRPIRAYIVELSFSYYSHPSTNHGGAAAWAGWAMAHPKFWLGGPQCTWSHQYWHVRSLILPLKVSGSRCSQSVNKRRNS